MDKTLFDKKLKNYPWTKAINRIKFKYLPQTKVSSKVKSRCYTKKLCASFFQHCTHWSKDGVGNLSADTQQCRVKDKFTDSIHHSSPRIHHESEQPPRVPVQEEAFCRIYVFLGHCFQIPRRLHINASLLFNCPTAMTSKKAARFSCRHSCISHGHSLVLSKPTCTKERHPQSGTGSTLSSSSSKWILNVSAKTQNLALPQFRCSDSCNAWTGQGDSSL